MNKSELSVRRTPICPAAGVFLFWKWHETQTAGRPCPCGPYAPGDLATTRHIWASGGGSAVACASTAVSMCIQL